MRQHPLGQKRTTIARSYQQSQPSIPVLAHPTLQLQGAIGNQAVNQSLSTQQQSASTKPQFRGLSQELAGEQTQTANQTGLPDQLQIGIETLSGYSMDDVRVHYNSKKPGQLQAHAYAQGRDIHLASGQEKYLPHEAWHVVQQKQGRVKPIIQIKGGLNVNNDSQLEREANVMGTKALKIHRGAEAIPKQIDSSLLGSPPFQKSVSKSSRLSSQTAPTQLFGISDLITSRPATWVARQVLHYGYEEFVDMMREIGPIARDLSEETLTDILASLKNSASRNQDRSGLTAERRNNRLERYRAYVESPIAKNRIEDLMEANRRGITLENLQVERRISSQASSTQLFGISDLITSRLATWAARQVLHYGYEEFVDMMREIGPIARDLSEETLTDILASLKNSASRNQDRSGLTAERRNNRLERYRAYVESPIAKNRIEDLMEANRRGITLENLQVERRGERVARYRAYLTGFTPEEFGAEREALTYGAGAHDPDQIYLLQGLEEEEIIHAIASTEEPSKHVQELFDKGKQCREDANAIEKDFSFFDSKAKRELKVKLRDDKLKLSEHYQRRAKVGKSNLHRITRLHFVMRNLRPNIDMDKIKDSNLELIATYLEEQRNRAAAGSHDVSHLDEFILHLQEEPMARKMLRIVALKDITSFYIALEQATRVVELETKEIESLRPGLMARLGEWIQPGYYDEINKEIIERERRLGEALKAQRLAERMLEMYYSDARYRTRVEKADRLFYTLRRLGMSKQGIRI